MGWSKMRIALKGRAGPILLWFSPDECGWQIPWPDPGRSVSIWACAHHATGAMITFLYVYFWEWINSTLWFLRVELLLNPIYATKRKGFHWKAGKSVCVWDGYWSWPYAYPVVWVLGFVYCFVMFRLCACTLIRYFAFPRCPAPSRFNIWFFWLKIRPRGSSSQKEEKAILAQALYRCASM